MGRVQALSSTSEDGRREFLVSQSME